MKPNTSFAGVIFGDRLPLPKVAMRVVEMKRFNFDRTFIVSNHPEIFSFLVRGNTEVVASCEEVLARLEGFSGTVVVVSDKSTCRKLDSLPLTDGFSEQYEDYKFYIGGSNDHDVATVDAVDTIVASSGHNVSRLPVVVYERFNSEPPPVLPVCFITHNRTAVACHCLDALCKRLKYAGKLHFCICDDMSEKGHIEALVKTLKSHQISDFSLHFTSEKRHGLGASMNNGLKYAFKMSPVALTVEDDFLLVVDTDFTPFVTRALRDDVAGIKLAANMQVFAPAIHDDDDEKFVRIIGNKRINKFQQYTFNNLVMLRTKKTFDQLGWYLENCIPETSESDMVYRFNKATDSGRDNSLKILWPKALRLDTMYAGMFEHVGISTSGHDHKIRNKFVPLNSPDADKEIITTVPNPFFHIVVPCYNDAALLDRCLKSLDSQDFSDYEVSVVDDASDNEETLRVIGICSKHRNVRLLPLLEKRYGGGARNHAMDNGPASRYTLFLDSDDELVAADVLKRIHTFILGKAEPDIVSLDFITPNGVVHRGVGPAPWMRCTKTELVARFAEDRAMCNDTLQYIKTLQSEYKIERAEIVAIRYNSDNAESGWHSLKKKCSRANIEGMLMTLADLKERKWSGRAATESDRMFKYIMQHAVASLNSMVTYS